MGAGRSASREGLGMHVSSEHVKKELNTEEEMLRRTGKGEVAVYGVFRSERTMDCATGGC